MIEEFIHADREAVLLKGLYTFQLLLRMEADETQNFYPVMVRCRFGGEEHVADRALVRITFSNGKGVLELKDCPRLQDQGFPLLFDTRDHTMKMLNHNTLLVIGSSAALGNYVLWIGKDYPRECQTSIHQVYP